MRAIDISAIIEGLTNCSLIPSRPNVSSQRSHVNLTKRYTFIHSVPKKISHFALLCPTKWEFFLGHCVQNSYHILKINLLSLSLKVGSVSLVARRMGSAASWAIEAICPRGEAACTC